MSIVIKWYSSNGFVALSGGATSEDSLFYGSVSKSKYADELRDYARDRDGVVAGLSGGYVPSTPWPKQFYGGRVRSDFNFEDVATQNLARGEPSTIIVSNFPDVNKFWQAYDKASELKEMQELIPILFLINCGKILLIMITGWKKYWHLKYLSQKNRDGLLR